MNFLLRWFYGTILGGIYFEFLLWIDKKRSKSPKYLSPKEVTQVIRQYSLLNEGVTQVKKKVNSLINSRNKEEYNLLLSELEDMMNLADRDSNTPQAKFSEILRDMAVKKSSKDINTHTEMAKMIEQRIEDTKELWDDQYKRKLMRDIRKASQLGDKDLVNKLQMEFQVKYGRSNTRLK